MESILIKSAAIIDEGNAMHGNQADVLIENGRIAKLGKVQAKADKVIEAKGMFLSIGWFDMRASFGDPGYEHREDLESGIATAAAGGFTGVALVPNNKPVTQTKNEVSYLKSRNQHSITEIFPIAAVSIDARGEELTEMIDLHHAGAVAFSDGIEPIWHTDILLKSLQYLQKFDGLLINKPEDIRLNLYGTMNEGINSTMLGMKGMPKLAEELIIQRDLELLAYAGGRLHFTNISSERSLAMIRAARKRGLNVSCDVASCQMLFDDAALAGFDTNFKVNPPFREKKDNKALIKGIQDGTIEVIVSSHIPQDEENKKLEFDLAAFGVIGLQTVAANLTTLSESVEMTTLIKAITVNPRKLLHLNIPKIEEGAEANLTLFDPNHHWVLDNKSNRSKSKNSPYWGQKLKGRTLATFNNGKHLIEQSLS
ncbi:Dihydroorotase [Fulvivirga imtechensis AK7]|uniref:Dihydroorotase n=1 Tax=Fulvivirga imtechensis AK7 TaxID=1237149 RepID=L8JJD0_9BACT|nr:dihydroorotase [Fulvivirga imtechensis]ELR68905.1 Dihydroorotase [Fulvivirga imtechensis AK7]